MQSTKQALKLIRLMRAEARTFSDETCTRLDRLDVRMARMERQLAALRRERPISR